MAEVSKHRSVKGGSYVISEVRRGTGPHEYVVTLTRNGKTVGDVKVRAPRSAPAYFNDTKRRTLEKAG